jgi:hypothetical protein
MFKCNNLISSSSSSSRKMATNCRSEPLAPQSKNAVPLWNPRDLQLPLQLLRPRFPQHPRRKERNIRWGNAWRVCLIMRGLQHI